MVGTSPLAFVFAEQILTVASSLGTPEHQEIPETPDELRELARRVRVIASAVQEPAERRRLLAEAKTLEQEATAAEPPERARPVARS